MFKKLVKMLHCQWLDDWAGQFRIDNMISAKLFRSIAIRADG